MAVAAVLTENLERTFGPVRAVDGVNLSIAAGEIYGFLGPNGAGKTTVLRILCTLLRPSGGRAEVAGHDVARDPGAVRLRIGVALQEAALDDRQTGRELLRLQGRLYGLSPTEIDTRLAEVFELVDVGSAVDRRINTYSGGMKRRLDLAAALIHNPEVLFLDEPTTGLDPASRAAVWDEVVRLNRDLGMTVFLTTQYLEEADKLAQRVGIIHHGRIVSEGSPSKLKRAIGNDVIVVEVTGDAAAVIDRVQGVDGVDQVTAHGDQLTLRCVDGARTVTPVAVALSAGAVDVRSLTLRTPTLDDVFLELTGGRIGDEEADVAAGG
jgi:ABC-2 type transport system ATP-binding protein